MPAEGFLQRFHDLAEADEDFRCEAALAIRKQLHAEASTAGKSSASAESVEVDDDNVQYSLRRLVRGAQSSRQCCREGFSLALAEVLEEFPDEVTSVLQLVRQHAALQKGLRSGELKERLLGRLFACSAIIEAGCLRRNPSNANSKLSKKQRREVADGTSKGIGEPAVEIGLALCEIFSARQYLRAAATRLQAFACRDLCEASRAAIVGQVLEPWDLDKKLPVSTLDGARLDVHLVGLAFELRLQYEAALRAGVEKSALKSWPSCVRTNAMANPSMLSLVVTALGAELHQASVSDIAPEALRTFCRWLLRVPIEQEAARELFNSFDKSLFPEAGGSATQAQSLKGFGELALCMGQAGALTKDLVERSQAEKLLVAMFQGMKRGVELLFQMLSWQRAHSHGAAVFAQSKLAEALGAPVLEATPPQKGKQKNPPKVADEVSMPASWPLQDETRLAILEILQKQPAFGTLKGTFQRRWQQALVAPLSTDGVRARCTALFELLSANLAAAKANAAGEEGVKAAARARVCADQLVELSVHSKAPDEVIMAVLCLLLTFAYLRPADAGSDVSFSLKGFCESIGLQILSGGHDFKIPCIFFESNEDGGDAASKTAAEASRWQHKLWATLTGLLRRTSPETAEKRLAGEKGEAPNADHNVLRTLAFNGCLSDGSLWLLRLHQWWVFAAKASSLASPRVLPKHKRSRSDISSGASVASTAFTEKELMLRARCQKLCARVLAEPETEGSMTMRQRNALCSLPLALIFGFLQTEEGEGREAFRASVEELIEVLEKENLVGGEANCTKKKALQQRADALAVVPRMACELFVNTQGLTKEAARAAWRELGEFASDETLTSLCASVCDADVDDEIEADGKEDQNKGGGEDSDDEDEQDDGHGDKAARIAKFQAATKALKEAREKENVTANGNDDDDEIMLGGDEIWEQLMEDSTSGPAAGSLLSAFAASGLEDVDASGRKLSKRQKRLRQRQEDITRKFREVELVEIFIQRFSDKRPVAHVVLRQLFEALLANAARNKSNSKSAEGATDEKGGASSSAATPSKADVQLRRVEADMARRLGDVLSKTLKHVSRSGVVKEICKWHDTDEWAKQVAAAFSLGMGTHLVAADNRTLEVGAMFVYWLCCLHRSAKHHSLQHEDLKGWELAEDLLQGALKDWSSKKAVERWCAAIFSVFAVRASHVLLGLPWLDHIRNGKNTYVQRTQLALVSGQVLRNLPPEAESTRAFASRFVELCADLLQGTLDTSGVVTASQRLKLRRDVLRAMVALARIGRRSGQGDEGQTQLVSKASAKKISGIVQNVLDSLPARHGEVFQLCLHLQRSLRSRDIGGKTAAKVQGQQQIKGAEKVAKKRRNTHEPFEANEEQEDYAAASEPSPKRCKGSEVAGARTMV